MIVTILVCTFVLIIALIVHGAAICDKIDDRFNLLKNAIDDLDNSIETNCWRDIQYIKSYLSYLPEESKKKEDKPLDPRDQQHLPYVNPAWDNHPLYSIAKSLDSLDRYFTHNKVL